MLTRLRPGPSTCARSFLTHAHGPEAESSVLELMRLRRLRQCQRRRTSGGNRFRYPIEIAGSDLTLMTGRRIAGCLRGELGILQLGVGAHAPVAVGARQLIDRVVQRMKACKCDELELVAHCPELPLKRGDRRLVKVSRPVEGWRAVVRQQFPRVLGVDGLGEAARLR